MNEKSIRALLPKDLEGREDLAAQLYSAHNAAVETEKSKTAAVQKKLDTANATNAELQETISEMEKDETGKNELAALQEKLDKATADLAAEKEAHGATKTDYETEKTAARWKEEVYAAVLERGKLKGTAAEAVLADLPFDTSVIKGDKEGKITNLDDVVKVYETKPSIAQFWGKETKTEGAGAGSPPAGGDKNLTLDAVKNMTPEQINENWESVQNAMKV